MQSFKFSIAEDAEIVAEPAEDGLWFVKSEVESELKQLMALMTVEVARAERAERQVRDLEAEWDAAAEDDLAAVLKLTEFLDHDLGKEPRTLLELIGMAVLDCNAEHERAAQAEARVSELEDQLRINALTRSDQDDEIKRLEAERSEWQASVATASAGAAALEAERRDPLNWASVFLDDETPESFRRACIEEIGEGWHEEQLDRLREKARELEAERERLTTQLAEESERLRLSEDDRADLQAEHGDYVERALLAERERDEAKQENERRRSWYDDEWLKVEFGRSETESIHDFVRRLHEAAGKMRGFRKQRDEAWAEINRLTPLVADSNCARLREKLEAAYAMLRANGIKTPEID